MTAAWKQLRSMLKDLETVGPHQPTVGPSSHEGLALDPAPVPEYVGDLADTVEMSKGYTAMFGMMKRQCLENGLSETETEAYLIMWMNIMQMGEG